MSLFLLFIYNTERYIMKNILLLLSFVLLTTSCATFQVSTLNHDPIYDSKGNEIEVTVIKSQGQFDRLLRTDFTFRYNYAQYALTQPRSFDWNNRILGNRYNFYNPYGFNMWGSSYMSRDMMWNDWVWGYPYFTPHRWSPFGYDRWGYNNYYGWNNGYYGWGNTWNGYHNGWWDNNNYYGGRYSYHSGRRGSNNVVVGRRTNVIKDRVVINTNNSRPRIIRNNTNTNNNTNTIIIRNKPRVINNSKPRGYSRPEINNNNNNNNRPNFNNNIRNNNNSRPNTNTRSINTTPTRTSSPPSRSNGSVSRKRGN
jgi:hypothetical protein